MFMDKKTFLYARVSTGMQQNGLESQIRALREFCNRTNVSNYVIFQDENQSGTKKSRPALDDMMKRARNGECEKVVVYSFSRFARSVTHLLSALQEFEKLEIKFLSLSEAVDTDTPIGKALFTILGSVAELERDILAERVRLGLATARAKGIKIGRKKTRPSELIRRLRAKGLVHREIARIAGCSSGAVATELKAWAKEKEQGVETININSDIKPISESEKVKNDKVDATPARLPLEIVRY